VRTGWTCRPRRTDRRAQLAMDSRASGSPSAGPSVSVLTCATLALAARANLKPHSNATPGVIAVSKVAAGYISSFRGVHPYAIPSNLREMFLRPENEPVSVLNRSSHSRGQLTPSPGGETNDILQVARRFRSSPPALTALSALAATSHPGQPKVRSVMALLLLQANQVVHVDTIIESCGDRIPRAARSPLCRPTFTICVRFSRRRSSTRRVNRCSPPDRRAIYSHAEPEQMDAEISSGSSPKAAI